MFSYFQNPNVTSRCRPLVNLIKCRSTHVSVKAAAALESLADHNAYVQREFLRLDAASQLMKLLKVGLFSSSLT